MKFGIPISFLLHAGFLSGSIFLFRTPPPLPAERLIIPIDIINIADETNIRASVKRPEKQQDKQSEPDPAAEPEPLPDPAAIPAPEPEAAPAPLPEPEPDPDPTQDAALEPEPAPEEPAKDSGPTPEPQAEPPVFSLDDLSALVDHSRGAQPENNQQKILQSEETLYAFANITRQGAGAGDGLALSEIDALRAAMYKCWRIPAGAKNPESLIIPVDVKLYRDGHVASVKLLDEAAIRASSNPHMAIAADNALRAVSKCSPYDFLPADRYDNWKQMSLTFRPVFSQ